MRAYVVIYNKDKTKLLRINGSEINSMYSSYMETYAEVVTRFITKEVGIPIETSDVHFVGNVRVTQVDGTMTDDYFTYCCVDEETVITNEFRKWIDYKENNKIVDLHEQSLLSYWLYKTHTS